MNPTAYRPLPAVPALLSWIWSWLAASAGSIQDRRMRRRGALGRPESLPVITLNCPKRPAAPPAAPSLHISMPRISAAVHPSDGNSPRAAGAPGLAAQWAAEHSVAPRHNYCTTPEAAPERAASALGLGTLDSGTAPWNREDRTSGISPVKKLHAT